MEILLLEIKSEETQHVWDVNYDHDTQDKLIDLNATPQERAAYEKYPWYFPGITHTEANEMLRGKAVGAYLVKKGTNPNTLTGFFSSNFSHKKYLM